MDNNFELLNRNPISKFMCTIKSTLKNNRQFFVDHTINFKTFISSYHNISHLYGLPKIHKSDIPIRPVENVFTHLYQIFPNLLTCF